MLRPERLRNVNPMSVLPVMPDVLKDAPVNIQKLFKSNKNQSEYKKQNEPHKVLARLK